MLANAAQFMWRGIEALQPMLQARYGTMPYFEVHRFDGPTPFTVPFNVNYDPVNARWFIRFYVQNVQRSIDRRWFGLLFHQLTHELLHMYSMDLLRKKLRIGASGLHFATEPQPRSAASAWDKFSHWTEGAPELVALSTTVFLSARGMDDWYLRCAFGSIHELENIQSLTDAAVLNLAHNAALLRRARKIPEATIANLALPFVVPADLVNAADAMAQLYLRKPMPAYHSQMPYALGILRFSQLVSADKMPLKDVVFNPIDNRRLRLLTRQLSTAPLGSPV